MKRSWMGAALLVVLLAGALAVTFFMGRVHDPIARDLTAAAEAAASDSWDQAGRLFRRARGAWEVSRVFRACFADHSPVEEVDACFAQAEVYLRAGERTAFAAACAGTARSVEAMGEAHSLRWENLL